MKLRYKFAACVCSYWEPGRLCWDLRRSSESVSTTVSLNLIPFLSVPNCQTIRYSFFLSLHLCPYHTTTSPCSPSHSLFHSPSSHLNSPFPIHSSSSHSQSPSPSPFHGPYSHSQSPPPSLSHFNSHFLSHAPLYRNVYVAYLKRM